MKHNDGGPAFPCDESHGDDYEGMTLRDYFAAKAMPIILSDIYYARLAAAQGYGEFASDAADDAYAVADAMLSARVK